MWTGKMRYWGLSVLLLALIGASVLAWEQLTRPMFVVVVAGIFCFLGLLALIRDGWHQTSPENLEERGIFPDDSNLPVSDPGLRRDYSPMLPFSLSRQPSRTRAPRSGARPAVRSRPRPSPAAAVAKSARNAPVRQRGQRLEPDATVTFAGERQAAGIDDLLVRLDIELVGLAPVKQKVAEIGSLLLVDRARQRFGLSASRPNLHMCFTGAPGTGKTTVALMMADLLHRLGYLDQGQLVHAMRDDLVGQYIGQTAPRTKHVLARAMGGVLFIDEAYSLYRDGDSRDYGQECIDILMQVMENDRDKIVVILAGYKDRMDYFFESNPGMRSRIAHHLDFAAYPTEELLAIGQLMLGRSSYYLSDEAATALRDYLSAQRSQVQFANARSVRNALERARLQHAYRLAAEPDRPWTRDDLMRLERVDILMSRDPV
jgi:probable Rubsico expression protein CbbX